MHVCYRPRTDGGVLIPEVRFRLEADHRSEHVTSMSRLISDIGKQANPHLTFPLIKPSFALRCSSNLRSTTSKSQIKHRFVLETSEFFTFMTDS